MQKVWKIFSIPLFIIYLYLAVSFVDLTCPNDNMAVLFATILFVFMLISTGIFALTATKEESTPPLYVGILFMMSIVILLHGVLFVSCQTASFLYTIILAILEVPIFIDGLLIVFYPTKIELIRKLSKAIIYNIVIIPILLILGLIIVSLR